MADREKLPYVGVSGVNGDSQQRTLELLWDTIHLDGARRLLLGVKAVHNTQWLDRPNKYGTSWYPVGEETFAHALLPRGENYGVAQMYLDPQTAAEVPEYPRAFVDRTIERGRRWLNAIQFDMLPYDITDTTPWRSLFDHIHAQNKDVILQCHKRAMAAGPEAAVERLKTLGPVDYVLFDASHGQGVEMNSDLLLRYLDAAHADRTLAGNRTAFGVAGGLDAGTVKRHIPRILQEFPDTSWDAEGKLHPRPYKTTDEATGEETWHIDDQGRLNTGLSWQYLQASANAVRGR